MVRNKRLLIGLSILAVVFLFFCFWLVFGSEIDRRLTAHHWRLIEYDTPPIMSLTGFDYITYDFWRIGNLAIHVNYPDGRTDTYDTSCYTNGNIIVISGQKGTYTVSDDRVFITYEDGTHEILACE